MRAAFRAPRLFYTRGYSANLTAGKLPFQKCEIHYSRYCSAFEPVTRYAHNRAPLTESASRQNGRDTQSHLSFFFSGPPV